MLAKVTALPINWDAWSAIGTVSATIVALFLPKHMADREWKRQEKRRTSESAASHREILSAVDRVLAYREAAIALFAAEPVYRVGFDAIKKIGLNSHINADLLRLAQIRAGLSDGALYASIAALRIADDITVMCDEVIATVGTRDPKWAVRAMKLRSHASLAAMAAQRSAGVRGTWGLADSTSAVKIRDKYLPLSEAIVSAMAVDAGGPTFDLDSTAY